MRRLQPLIDHVRDALERADAEVGPYSAAKDISDWHRRRRDVMENLALALHDSVGATINNRSDGCGVKIAGIRSTSTSGIAGALHNWLRAARKRAGEA